LFPASGAYKPETKKAMKLNTVEGAFAVAADNLAAPYLSLFALALGATPSQIGMLTALPNFLGNIFQIPAGLWSERMKDKRTLPIVGGYLSRSTWIVLAFLPFLFPAEYRVSVVIFLAAFRILTANLGVPAWTALQADLVPQSIRGRYYANRNVVINICAFAATIVATILLRVDYPRNYHLIFTLATISGLTSIVIFTKIPFDQSASKAKPVSTDTIGQKLSAFWAVAKTDKQFMNYAKSALIWNFGVSFASSLFPVYFVDVQGGKVGSWAIFTAVNIATQVFFQRYWGRLADKFGQKAVLTFSGLGVVAVPLLWSISPNLWFPIIIYFVNGFAWGGYNLAAFNMLLEITPDDDRTLYVSAYNTVMGVSTAVGPLLGGFAAEVFGLRPIFLLSTVMRGAGLLFLFLMVQNTSEHKIAAKDLIPKPKSRRSR